MEEQKRIEEERRKINEEVRKINEERERKEQRRIEEEQEREERRRQQQEERKKEERKRQDEERKREDEKRIEKQKRRLEKQKKRGEEDKKRKTEVQKRKEEEEMEEEKQRTEDNKAKIRSQNIEKNEKVKEEKKDVEKDLTKSRNSSVKLHGILDDLLIEAKSVFSHRKSPSFSEKFALQTQGSFKPMSLDEIKNISKSPTRVTVEDTKGSVVALDKIGDIVVNEKEIWVPSDFSQEDDDYDYMLVEEDLSFVDDIFKSTKNKLYLKNSTTSPSPISPKMFRRKKKKKKKQKVSYEIDEQMKNEGNDLNKKNKNVVEKDETPDDKKLCYIQKESDSESQKCSYHHGSKVNESEHNYSLHCEKQEVIVISDKKKVENIMALNCGRHVNKIKPKNHKIKIKHQNGVIEVVKIRKYRNKNHLKFQNSNMNNCQFKEIFVVEDFEVKNGMLGLDRECYLNILIFLNSSTIRKV
jgi:hypothetical protein